jgi:hypothetical protein
VSPGEGARLVRDFERAIEAAKRFISRSKIASKGQSRFGDEEKLAGLFEGRGAEGSNNPEAGIKSLQSLKYRMILCDAPFLTLTHSEVNNYLLRLFSPFEIIGSGSNGEESEVADTRVNSLYGVPLWAPFPR